MSKLSVELEVQSSEFKAGLQDAQSALRATGDEAGRAGKGGFTVLKGVLANLATKAITTTISGLTKGLSALKNFGLSAIEVGKQFDASMSNVAALSGATGDDLKLLSDTAQHFGKTTQFSASEAADALGYMALAGWDAKQSAESLGGVLDLAAASGMGLAQASDMVTDYLSAFSNSAMTSTQFADMLAYAQSHSNTSAEQLGEAYRNCAAKMNAAGQSAQTTTSLLEAMANQGYKGSEAGTALSSVLKDMTAKMKNGNITIGKQIIAVQDAAGNYRSLIDILGDVEAATEGMGTAEKNAALSSVFTSKSLTALGLVFNEGIDQVREYSTELGDCEGSAQDMAKTMNDNLAGDIKAANSALEGFKITISDQLTPTLREFVQFGTDELGKLDDAFKTGGIEGFADQLGKSLSKGINMIKGKAPKVISVVKTVIKTVGREALNLAGELINKFFSNFGKITDKALKIVKDIGSKILSKLPTLFDQILKKLPNLLRKLGNFVKEAIPKLVSTIGEMLGSLLQNAPQIIAAGIELAKSLITGILTAIPKLFTGIRDGFVNSFDNVSHEVHPYIQKMNDELAEFRQGLESIPDAADSVASSLAEIDAKQRDAEHWIEIFDELYQKTDLTAEENQNLNTAVDRLNELYPELGIKIDEETGKWNLNTQEIEDNIKMLGARARADAYYDAAKQNLTEMAQLEATIHTLEQDRDQYIQDTGYKTLKGYADLIVDNGKRIAKAYGDDEWHWARYVKQEYLDWYNAAMPRITEIESEIDIYNGKIEEATKKHEELNEQTEWMYEQGAEQEKEALKTIGDAAEDAGEKIEGVADDFDKLPDAAEEASQKVQDALDVDSESWGKDMVDNYADGIEKRLSRLRNVVSSVAEVVRERLHFSKPDVGPLKDFDSYAPDMMALFAQGIKDNTKLVSDQIEKSFGFDLGTVITNSLDGSTAGVYRGANKTYNITIGNIEINAPNVKNVEELYDLLMDRMNAELASREAVFA